MPPELLEEERDTAGLALITKVAEPGELRRPRAGLALAARDQPLDALEIQLWQAGEKWLRGDEAHRRRHAPQRVDAPHVLRRLDRHAHPDVRRPREARRQAR